MIHRSPWRFVAPLLALCVTGLAFGRNDAADLVVLEAKIYTADAGHSMAESLAVSGGKIVAVGAASATRPFIGPQTRIERLGGRLVLPGLFDSHLHPISMIKVESCDLENRPKSLRELGEFARDCLTRYPVPAGGWLNVHQWNFSDGNQPDADLHTLVAALDRASTSIPIQLIGSDGHHGAYNSAALARARLARGAVIGFSKASLSNEFSAYKNLIGVDAQGNPNGAVNETAKALMGAPSILMAEFDKALAARGQLPQLLNSAGITGILDAKVSPEILPLYDLLDREKKLTFRANLAQFYDPDQIKGPDGRTDFGRMLTMAGSVRAKYAANPLIRADIVKLFADGVLEGNPYAVPPTLPNTLALHPYLQPIFGKDPQGSLTVTGYVDPHSAVCELARAQPGQYSDPERLAEFMKAHGFHPAQCTVSTGQLRHDRTTFMEFVERFHRAGFALHIHVIGDGSLAVTLDALEAARAADGVASQHDGLAHVQLAQPSDVARIGRDHLYVAFTYSWANADPEYDMTVVPFIDHVAGNSFAALHSPTGYYESNVYPFKSVKQAGGILVAGSDAPVNTSDPQPFVNMATAVTRRLPGQKPQNPSQAIGIRDVIDAYTINGARFLNRNSEAGSIEVGKSADFIVLDQDILALADSGRGDDVAKTHVLGTWFKGAQVYGRPAP
jgi:predicted amidohydrolase YtcJ